MVCPICLEKLDASNEDVLVTDCNHTFHNDCLVEWLNINTKCPYCRQRLFYDLICYPTNHSYKSTFMYNHYKRRSVVINGISTSFIEKNLKHKFLNPVSWLSHKSNSKTYDPVITTPLYSLNYNNDTILITAYTRLVLLYNETDVSISLNRDINELEYYKSDTESNYINEKTFLVLFEWFYDVMHVLKYRYNFIYDLVYNTVIFDLLYETVKEFKVINNKLYQGILISAMFNMLMVYNIDISLENLNYYTLNSCNVNDLEKYVAFQKKIII